MNWEGLGYEQHAHLEQILRSIAEIPSDVRRELGSSVSKLEIQLHEKIEDLKKKLQGSWAWNLLIEEAEKLNLTPEGLLKRLLAGYARKRRSG